ncbi:hypothetical protein CVT25_002734 [Psilocybe cyanescens]|uniref:Hydrophobin n=1 Tax=Psilocybe cyanescens TaxID=93625 RepID=A0A409WL66_PSICY|nr:hypothetical protein CVT25_002734 [Psilocybe cyanescens]
MFSHVSAVALLAFPLLATANAVTHGGGAPSDLCTTDRSDIQCCKQVGTAHTLAANNARTCIGSLLSFVTAPDTAILGIGCTLASVLFAAGNPCNGEPVCCVSNQFNGLVNVDCTPLDIYI